MPFAYAPALRAGTPAALIQSNRTRIGRLGHAAVSHCSDVKPAITLTEPTATAEKRERSLHRTTIVEAILIILDDSRDSVKRIAAIRILRGVL